VRSLSGHLEPEAARPFHIWFHDFHGTIHEKWFGRQVPAILLACRDNQRGLTIMCGYDRREPVSGACDGMKVYKSSFTLCHSKAESHTGCGSFMKAKNVLKSEGISLRKGSSFDTELPKITFIPSDRSAAYAGSRTAPRG